MRSMVEGFCPVEPEGPSTAFGGPPPLQTQGRIKTHETPAGETSPASVHPWTRPSMSVCEDDAAPTRRGA